VQAQARTQPKRAATTERETVSWMALICSGEIAFT
jgi:hypothetical protein